MAAAVQIDGWLVVVTERAAGGRTVINGTVTTNTAAYTIHGAITCARARGQVSRG